MNRCVLLAREYAACLPICAFFLLLLPASILNAQSANGNTPPSQPTHMPEWQKVAGGKLEFEVASVRQSPSNTPLRTNFGLDSFEDTGHLNGIFSANVYLKGYIEFAYKMPETSDQESLLEDQLPSWWREAPFAIEARAEGNPTKDQMRLMMQSLLEDRFKLKIHIETRQLPIYALVLAEPGKLGPGLQPHPPGAICTERSAPALGPSPTERPPVFCGDSEWQENGQMHIRMLDSTMEHIATLLTEAGYAQGDTDGRLIVNETGLTGLFDLDLICSPQKHVSAENGAGGQTAIEAMKKQLGLKLIRKTGPVNIYVVDHIERPSEN